MFNWIKDIIITVSNNKLERYKMKNSKESFLIEQERKRIKLEKKESLKFRPIEIFCDSIDVEYFIEFSSTKEALKFQRFFYNHYETVYDDYEKVPNSKFKLLDIDSAYEIDKKIKKYSITEVWRFQIINETDYPITSIQFKKNDSIIKTSRTLYAGKTEKFGISFDYKPQKASDLLITYKIKNKICSQKIFSNQITDIIKESKNEN